jgi:hypothetical protein
VNIIHREWPVSVSYYLNAANFVFIINSVETQAEDSYPTSELGIVEH